MRPLKDKGWLKANQRYLDIALDEVRIRLQHYCRLPVNKKCRRKTAADRMGAGAVAARMEQPPALEVLCRTFRLSAFERMILLQCAGIELNGSFAQLCATVQGGGNRGFATFGTALAAFPEGHWSALNPASPLRYWRLIEVEKGGSITASPLRIDERVLHSLTGVHYMDERLWGLVRTWVPAAPLVPSLRDIADRIAGALRRTDGGRELPAVLLHGGGRLGRRDVAASACRSLGLNLHIVSSHSLPGNVVELEQTARMWNREALLGSTALLVETEEQDSTDAARSTVMDWIVDNARGILFVSSRAGGKFGARPG